jgi:transcriptional regulator with XRE-family HTH domain
MGNFVRAWRNFYGMTLAELSERTELSISQISRIEAGTRGYSRDSLGRIAAAFRISIAELLDRDPRDPDKIWAMLDALRALPPSEQQRAIEMIRLLGGSPASRAC